MAPILLTYQSPTGTTRQLMATVADLLQAQGRTVDLREMAAVPTLGKSAAVIIAAPVHGMRWLPDAEEWVHRHAEGLRQRTVALVAVSYVYLTGRAFWRKQLWRRMESVRKVLPHATIQIWGGRIEKPLPAPVRWIFGIPADAPTDMAQGNSLAAWTREWSASLVPPSWGTNAEVRSD